MLTNRNSSKCKIIKLCNRLLNEDTNISDIFYELYSLLDDFYINEDLKNFCSLIIDETDWIPQKEKRKFCSEDFINKISKEEKEIFDFYKNDIKRVATQIIKEINDKSCFLSMPKLSI
jgi:hypothetical protein